MLRLFLPLLVIVSTGVFGQYAPPIALERFPADYPDAVRVADMNGDGIQDLVVLSYADRTASWYPGTGALQFGDEHPICTLGTSGDMDIADFDQDGDIDVFVWYGIPVESGPVYRNDGAGNFTEWVDLSNVIGSMGKMGFTEITGQGVPNFMKTSKTGGYWTYWDNEGLYGFLGQSHTRYVPKADEFAWGDVDADGDNDVLVQSEEDTLLYLFTNNGEGGFQQEILPSFGFLANDLLIGNIDSDPELEIVAMGQWSPNLAYSDLGAEFPDEWSDPVYLEPFSQASLQISSATLIDTDGDGIQEIAYAKPEEGIVIYRDAGLGAFDQETIWQSANAIRDLRAVDMDNDGDLDLVVCDLNGYRTLALLNDGAGGFLPEQVLTEYPGPVVLLTNGDVDGDGREDAISVFQYGRISMYRGLENGYEERVDLLQTGYPIKLLRCVDVDGDGDNDLVLCGNPTPAIAWSENLGDGTFTAATTLFQGTSNGLSLAFGDVDADGDVDIVHTSNSLLSWLRNNGNGTFTNEIVVTTATTNAADVADIDADGDLDLVGLFQSDAKLKYYKNNGDGIFTLFMNLTINTGGSHIKARDMDGDGDLDILLSNGATGVTVCWNFGYPLYGFSGVDAAYSPAFFHTIRDVATMDMDQDGDLDLILAIGGEDLAWAENFGNYEWSELRSIHFESNIGGTIALRLAMVDRTHSGVGDIVFSKQLGDDVMYMQNVINGPYAISGRVFVDLDGDGVQGPEEVGFNGVPLTIQPDDCNVISMEQGQYVYHTLAGNFTVGVVPSFAWDISTDSITYQVQLDDDMPMATSIDFGLHPTVDSTLLGVDVTSMIARCSSVIRQWVTLTNVGTTSPNGIIDVQLNDLMTFQEGSIAPDSTNGQHVYWHFDDLRWNMPCTFHYDAWPAGAEHIGDTLIATIRIMELDDNGEVVSTWNDTWTDTWREPLRCSYDPNDKLVDPQGIGPQGLTDISTPTLEYTIRFQNTGTDTARTVHIVDRIDPRIVPGSLRIVASSHALTSAQMDESSVADFLFEGIQLPDSNVDELASHGFVKFTVDLLPGASHGTRIENTGEIYFDLNTAVVTNTTVTTLVDCSQSGLDATIGPIGWDALGVPSGFHYQWFLDDDTLPGATSNLLIPLENGYYSVLVYDAFGCSSTSEPFPFFTTQIAEQGMEHVVIIPNPMMDAARLVRSRPMDASTIIDVVDTDGRIVSTMRGSGTNEILIQRNAMAPGMYAVRVQAPGELPNVVRMLLQ